MNCYNLAKEDCLCFVLYSNGLLLLAGRLVRERWDWLFGTKFLECLSLSGCLRILMIEVLWLPCYIALMLGTLLPCYINNAWYWCQVRCCLGILMPHHPKFVDQQICKGCTKTFHLHTIKFMLHDGPPSIWMRNSVVSDTNLPNNRSAGDKC